MAQSLIKCFSSAAHFEANARKVGQVAPRFRPLLSADFCQHVAVMSASSAPVMTPPECLFRPLEFPNKLLMGAGPSNAPPRVLEAQALPLLGHLHPDYTQIMDEVKQGIQYLFQTRNNWTFALQGSGHAAMEAMVCNLLEPGEVAVVCENGLWGTRFADMVERNGSVAKKIIHPMGQVFTREEIEEALKKYNPAIVFVTHGESSGGTAQPLEGLGSLCRRYNSLLVVDSVAAIGGVPLFMDAWEIDCLYAGSQKVLSVSPGTAPMSFSDFARKKIENRATRIRSYYLDATELSNYWGCDNQPRRYHHTSPISLMYGLREGLANLSEVGLQQSWANHRACAEHLWEGIEKLGLQLLVTDKGIRNPCVTCIKVPEGIHWKDISDFAMKNYKVEIAGGLGDLAGKIWRIGIMGHNCALDKIDLALTAMKAGLVSAGYKVPQV